MFFFKDFDKEYMQYALIMEYVYIFFVSDLARVISKNHLSCVFLKSYKRRLVRPIFEIQLKSN